MLAGSLAFDILDRVTGEWSVISSGAWLEAAAETMILKTPTLWLLINLVFWVLLGFGLIKFMRYALLLVTRVVPQHSTDVRVYNLQALGVRCPRYHHGAHEDLQGCAHGGAEQVHFSESNLC